MSAEPALFEATRKALDAAGYSASDPETRALVALVNLGFRPPNCDAKRFPDKKAHSRHTSRMHAQLKVIRNLLIEAKLAGVNDTHLSTVPAAAASKHGRRAWGEILYDPSQGWRYVPPGRTYLEIRATHRLAVISGLQSAIFTADVEGRKVRGRLRRRITKIKPSKS